MSSPNVLMQHDQPVKSLAIVGIGNMGRAMGATLVEDDFVVHGHDTDRRARDAGRERGIEVHETLEEAVNAHAPAGDRVVLLMLPPGEITQTSLKKVSGLVGEGDVVIDGGNSWKRHTAMWHQWLGNIGVGFLGIGFGGGAQAKTEGFPTMVGGDRSAYTRVTPILDSLARPDGSHEYFGEGGAGHSVKTIQNLHKVVSEHLIAVIFSMLEREGIDPKKAFELFDHGSTVAGAVNNSMIQALRAVPDLSNVDGKIAPPPQEAMWMIEEAKQRGLSVEMIEHVLRFREHSGEEHEVGDSTVARVIAALEATHRGESIPMKKKA